MPRSTTVAQRAAQITFVLKGHLKNVQISYLRAAALLAKVRDEKLFAALKHDTIEGYAEARLGLGRASLYRYLQIHDWVKRAHPGWLAKHPKGFIPELSDAHALMWIDDRLDDEHIGPETRKELEALRKKGLAGKLAKRELETFRRRAAKRRDSLAAVATSLVAIRRRAAALPECPPEVVDMLDDLCERVKAASRAVARASRLGSPSGMRLVAIGGKSLPG